MTESRRLIFHCGFKCKVFSGGKKLIRKECGFVFRYFLGVFCLKRFCKSAINQLLVWSTRQFVAVFDRNTLRLFLELANRDVVWVMEISLTTCCSWKSAVAIWDRGLCVCFLPSIRSNEKNRFNVEQKNSENLKNNIEKFFLFFKTYASKTLVTLSSNFDVDESKVFFRNWKMKFSSDHRRLETSWHSSHF